MPRPEDWSALGMHGDPTPGDPTVLASFQSALHDTEALGNEVTSGLNRILDKTGSGNGFVGKAAEALREKIDGHLKQFIDAIGQSFGLAADATSAYRTAVEDAQARTEQALNAAQGLSKEDPQLAGLKDQAHAAQGDYNDAVRTYQHRLTEAEHLIRQPLSGWQLFLQAIGILEIILAIVGAIFGGWIGLLAFGLGMVVFIGTLVEFAEGKASILDVVLAFVGILFPSTKGINVGALAKGVFNALKNLPKSLSAGVTKLGGTLGHLLTSGITIKNIYNGVTALPGLVLRGLSGMADLAMKGVKITAAGLKLLANTFRTDFQVATAGISTTIGKVAVYPVSFGGRFLLGAVLPVDFFELGAGFRGAFKMGFGTRLLTPTAHLPQSALGGALHVGALTGGHGGLTGLPTGASFNGLGHGALQGFDPGGLRGLNTGIDSRLGGLHGINLGTDIGGMNTSLTSLHSLNGGTHLDSVGNVMANAGGLDAVDHLAAFDHATGFQRTAAGLLEPLPTHLGGTNLAAGHGFSDLGSSGLHALRGDLTPSASGLSASLSDAMSSVRVATGHVEDFHELGIPELRSIVDGDISGIRMTHDGISMQVGAQNGMPTTLHVDYRGSGLTNGEGKQIVVAPEVHQALGTADLVAAHGTAHGLQTPPPAATAGHVTTDVKTGSAASTPVTADVKAGSVGTTSATADIKAGTLGAHAPATDIKATAVDVNAGAAVDAKAGATGTAPVTVEAKAGAAVSSPAVEIKTGSVGMSSVTTEVKAGSVGTSSVTGDMKAGSVGTSAVTADVKTGSAGAAATGGVKTGSTTGQSVGGGVRKAAHDLDDLSGGTRSLNSPERLAEEPESPSVTAQGDHLGVSARENLDLLGEREGTGDTAGAAATTHVRTGPDAHLAGVGRSLDDGSGAVLVGEHVALRPNPTPAPRPRPTAGGKPGPLSRFEAVTGGATGKTGKERLAAWDEFEAASAKLAGARRELDLTGGKLGRPSENVDQAAAKLDVQQAEVALDIAEGKLSRLGMDAETIEGHLDALGIPGPRPSRVSGAAAEHGAASAGQAGGDAGPVRVTRSEALAGHGLPAEGTAVGTKTGTTGVPAAVGRSLPFSPGEIERFWKLDGERIDVLFGGSQDPLTGDRREVWRKFTQARYDLGRLEGQVRDDQPHAGGSSGPSAHELKLEQDLSAAKNNLDELAHQLDELGVDATDLDRRLWDLHAQSLKEHPRLDGAGVQRPVTNPAGGPARLDDLMAQLQTAEKAVPSAESKAALAGKSYEAKAAKLRPLREKLAQLEQGTNKGAIAKAEKDYTKAKEAEEKALADKIREESGLQTVRDALKKANDDLAAGVDLHVATRDLAQRDVHRYVEKFAASGHLDVAEKLRAHAGDLHLAMKEALDSGRPVRWDQMSLSGKDVRQQAEQVLAQSAKLEELLVGPVTKSGRTTSVDVKVTQELKSSATALGESAEHLGSMLEKGFLKDAAEVGGAYALRAEHGPLSFTAGKLAQRVNHAVKDASPGEVVRVKDVFSTKKAVADFHELAQVVRKFRSDKAYGEVPTGTQWKAVLPGKRTDLAHFGDLSKLTPEQQNNFVRDLSQKNLERLKSDFEDLLKKYPGREQDFRRLLTDLQGLPYRIKHATSAYHAIANSGLMSSQGDLARRDVKFLASGKSSVKNTSSLGNDDFVFFRMDVGDEKMVTRYGSTTLVFDANVLKEHGGWVSLHDQLHPLDRPAMQKLEVKGESAPGGEPTTKVFRTAQYDEGFTGIGKHAQWTYTYPHSAEPDFTRTVTFEEEVFHGGDVTDALALSVVREVIHMGSEYADLVLKMSADDLGRLVSKLFRPEAKFGSGLPIMPRALDELSAGETKVLGVGPQPLHVHDPDGDGRYFPDGTMDPIGRWAGKHFDAGDDAFRSAEHGVQENSTKNVAQNLKDAKVSVQRSIDLTKEWKAGSPPARQQLVDGLLKKREDFLKEVTHLEQNWETEVRRLHGDGSVKGEATGSKEGQPAKGGKPKGGNAKGAAIKSDAIKTADAKTVDVKGADVKTADAKTVDVKDDDVKVAGDAKAVGAKGSRAETSAPDGPAPGSGSSSGAHADGSTSDHGVGDSGRLTPGEIQRLQDADAKRIDDLFGGSRHPLYDARVEAWGKLTQARNDIGRLQEQRGGERPHVGGSSGPSAHELKLRQDLSTAEADLHSAKRDLARLGLDPNRLDRDLSALYTQSLKERPRAVAGAHQASPHGAGEPHHLDELLSEHTKKAGQVPSAKVRLDDATAARDNVKAKVQAAKEKLAAEQAKYASLSELDKAGQRRLDSAATAVKSEEKNLTAAEGKLAVKGAEFDTATAKTATAWHALDSAVSDLVSAGTHSQQELSRLVDTFAAAADLDHAVRLQQHARELDIRARDGLGGPNPRPDQVIWRGQDVQQQVDQIRVQAAELEKILAPESTVTGEGKGRATDSGGLTSAEVQSHVDRLRSSVSMLDGVLGGFITDASRLGGGYALRNAHGPLVLAAGHLVELAEDAIRKAGPDDAVRLEKDFSTYRAAKGLRSGAPRWLREFRTGKAYADVPTGTQWQAVLPGTEGRWQTVLGDIETLTSKPKTPAHDLSRTELEHLRQESMEKEKFVENLSKENIRNLRQEIDRLIAGKPPAQQQALLALKQRLLDLPYRIKHATPAYHAIANSGVMSSQGDLARRNVKHLASGKSSANNTSNLGNDDFVFFRMEVSDGAMDSRYGPTTVVFDAEVLKDQGGWVSLHDQLHPLDRKTMQELSLDKKTMPELGDGTKVFRTAQYDEGFTDIGKRAQWTQTYPQNNGITRTVTFEQEVFHGEHVVEALALSVIREVDSIGGAFPAHVLGLDVDGLGKVVSQLFRPEAKFGSGLPITPMNAVVHQGMPRPLHVVNEHGDGRYFADGTIDPVARAAGKQHDMASDALRQADNSKATGHVGKGKDHLKDAKAYAQQSIDLTKKFQEGSTGERHDLAVELLRKRQELFDQIDAKLTNWQSGSVPKGSTPKGPAGKGPGAKAPVPEAAVPKASGSTTSAAESSVSALFEAEGTRVHTALSPIFGDKAAQEMVPVARGLVEHGDLSTPTESGRTFGLTKRAFDKHSKALEGKGLVKRVNGGLLLTEHGSQVLLPHGARPELPAPAQSASAHDAASASAHTDSPVARDTGAPHPQPSAHTGRPEESDSGRPAPGKAPKGKAPKVKEAQGTQGTQEDKAAKAAQHAKSVDPRLRTVLVQNGYATGDQFGVAAALHADPELRLLLIRDAKDFRDRSTDIHDFYLASGIDPSRVLVKELGEGQQTKDLKMEQWHEINADVLPTVDAGKMPRRKDFDDHLILPVGAATTLVGKRFSPELRETLRTAWKLDDGHFTPEVQQAVGSWLTDRGVPDAAGRDVVVLWTRFSGKRGEIHIEHDTSHTGMTQILDSLHHRTTDRPRGPLVLLAGDASAHSGRPSKFPAMAQQFRDSGLEVHDLTAFWKQPKGLDTWGGNTRIGQMRLFEYLNRASDGHLRHLGFRSGNLEALALSGHQVRYLEEAGSNGGARMAKWHAVDGTGRTADHGLAPGYERIVIDHPPTRSGQIVLADKAVRTLTEAKYKALYKGQFPDDVKAELKNLTDRFEHPNWVPGGGDRPYVRNLKPVEDKHVKGFARSDVDRVVDYLTAPHSVETPGTGHHVPSPGRPDVPMADHTVSPESSGPQRDVPGETGLPRSLDTSPTSHTSDDVPRQHVPAPETTSAPGAVGDAVRQVPDAVRQVLDAPDPFPAASPLPSGTGGRTPGTPPAPRPAAESSPSAPVRMTSGGQIGGADRVLPSEEAVGTVTRDLVAYFDDILTPAQRDTLRTDLRTQLGREVWPSLSALTRGESRTLTMDVAGFSGDVTVRAEVTKAETDGAFKSLEFEDGSESLVRDGFQRETRSAVTTGVLVKGKAAAHTDLTGHLSSNWSRSASHRTVSSGRLFNRAKTPEAALKLDVEVRFEFDFSAVTTTFGKHLPLGTGDGGRAGRVEVSTKVPVATAEADVRPPAEMRHYLPPARIEQTLALGGMDTVRDLFLVDADGERVSGTLHKALLGSLDDPHSLESYGRRAFGDGWPGVRELVLDRLGSLDSLQYRLKGLTAGEALEIDLGPDTGSLLVTAEVSAMKHLRNTDRTEFNTGSDVTRVHTRTKGSEHGVRATMNVQSADLHAGPTTVTGVGHAEFDREGAVIGQESVRTGTAVKMKVPGAVFDGVATLSFVHRADPLGAAEPATPAPHGAAPDTAGGPVRPVRGGRAQIGFQALVDAADARPVPEPAAFSAATRPPGPRRTEAPYLHEGDHAWQPSAAVWDDGLPSHTVVIDVLAGEERAVGAPPLPRLGDLVDGIGRDSFGPDWPGIRPAAHDMTTREQLAATLPQITRGSTARSTPLPVPLRSNAQFTLNGRLESLEFVRTLDAAEINLLSDVADELGGRLGSTVTHGQLAQGGVQPELAGDFTLAVHAPGGGVAHRYRTGSGVSAGHSSVAGAKYPEPMAVYIATVGVDAHVGRVGETAARGGSTEVRFVVAIPKDRTERYEVTKAGPQVFHRPAPAVGAPHGTGTGGGPAVHAATADATTTPAVPAPATNAARPGLTVRPPLRVTESGRIGNGDIVVDLPGDGVVKELKQQLSGTFGERWDQVEAEMGQFFDSIALQPRTAGLTGGDTWGSTFRAGPVTADIHITAADARMTEYLRVEDDFEFELGTESATAAAVQKDTHVRRTLWERAGFKTPHVSFTLGHVHHKESVGGHGVDVRGGAVAKNKTVEPAALFKGRVTYTVQVKVSHALPGRGGERTFTVTNDGQFAFPVRDLPADPATGAAHRPDQYYRVPDRIAESLRLGAEDVVLDTRPVRVDRAPGADTAGGAPANLVEDVLRQLDAHGPKVFGSGADWRVARAKLAERLPASEFQRRLKSMMSGQPWVVRVNGRELVISASVKEMTHTANTKATEFNSATLDSVGGGRTEAGPGGPQITSDGTNVTVVGTTDPVGASPAEVFGGGTLAHTTQTERLADSSSGVRSAAGTKTKVPGSVFDGVARLHFEFRDRWRPFGRGVDTHVSKEAIEAQADFDVLRDKVADLRQQLDARGTGRPGDAHGTSGTDGPSRGLPGTDGPSRGLPGTDGPSRGLPGTDGPSRGLLGTDGPPRDVSGGGVGDEVRAGDPAGRPQSADDPLRLDFDAAKAEFDAALTEQGARIQKALDARRTGRGALGFAPMTRRTFGVRTRRVGVAEIGFQAVIPSADAVQVPGPDLARFAAPEPGAGRPRPPKRSGQEPPKTEQPKPPESLLADGMSGGQLVRDLPDVQSLRGLLDSEGGKAFGGAWRDATRAGTPRSELVMGEFTKDRLMAELPRLTRGGELKGESFRVNGSEAWVSARAEIVGLTHVRPEPRAEVALAGEKYRLFTRRGLHSRQFFLLGQLGAVTSALENKLGAAFTFGGGFRRRTRSDQVTGGRTFSNAKIPTPLEHYDGHVRFTFTFHRGGTDTEVSGVVLAGFSVPSAEITDRVVVERGHVFTRPGAPQYKPRTLGTGHPTDTAHGETSVRGNTAEHVGTPVRGDTSVHGDTPVHGDASVRGDTSAHVGTPVHSDASDHVETSVRGNTSPHGNTFKSPSVRQTPAAVPDPIPDPIRNPAPDPVPAPGSRTAPSPTRPGRDDTLLTAHTREPEPVEAVATHTSPTQATPAQGRVATETHATAEEGTVSVTTPEPSGASTPGVTEVSASPSGPAHPNPNEAFETVRQQHPEPLARTPRWTMWGHNGDTPHTSAYAIENGALGLRGSFVPPATDGGLGAWHWYLPGETAPVTVTPLTLPSSSPAPGAAPAPRIAVAAGEHIEDALRAAPWSGGLHWRGDDGEDLYVFGPAGADRPAAVFADGLRPAGDALVHVATHVSGRDVPDSAWVTATRKIGWLREQAAANTSATDELLGRYGWRYDIAAPGGVDADATLDLAGPHPERAEVLYPGGVDSRYIRGAQRLEGGRPVGRYLTNPGFVEPGAHRTPTEGSDR
ncbi:hypothetical protein ACFC09_01975 [Streptomyces sp. NPDC056161]|uniref:scabin-related ADP-ribosyltransferase n=1 Tax=Streptomyces sp. NPDC056161 TaxID=3345732 RepID=UPI0035E09D69